MIRLSAWGVLVCVVIAMNFVTPGADAEEDDLDSSDTIPEHLYRGRLECTFFFQNFTYDQGYSSESYCREYFDGISCWPPTLSGNTAVLPCPYDQYQTTSVRRACLPNSTWAADDVQDLYGGEGECACVHCSWMNVISHIGYIMSLAACAVAFLIFLCSRTLHCTRNRIHWHLISSFMLKYMIFFIQPALLGVESVHPKRIILTLFYYLEMTNYFWMFVEGLYLHTLVVFALRIDADRISFWVYCIIGWGLPLVFVGVWAIVSVVVNPDGELISTSPDPVVIHEYVCIIGPILLVLVINCFFLLNIVRLLMSKLRMHGNRTSEIQHYRRAARATLVLVVLLGVGYILFICMSFLGTNLPPMGSLIFGYINALLAGTQGLAVAIIYVFLNTEVRTVLRRKWRRRFSNRCPNSILCSKRPKPRSSSYSKYDEQTCMSTMRSMAHNDTITDCYQEYDRGGGGGGGGGGGSAGQRGRHAKTTNGNEANLPVANGDTNRPPTGCRGNEKIQMDVVMVVENNGAAGDWVRTEGVGGEEAEEADPLLNQGLPKPTAAIGVSTATPVHEVPEDSVYKVE